MAVKESLCVIGALLLAVTLQLRIKREQVKKVLVHDQVVSPNLEAGMAALELKVLGDLETEEWCRGQNLESQTFLVDNLEECRRITAQLLSHNDLAMDVEGVELCRTGQVGLLQICTAAGQVYLFDIATLGQAAFDAGGLKEVLESESVCKVIFDGRADADALYHLHGVQLRRAYDLQIDHAIRYSNAGDRYVKGLQKCLDDSGIVPHTDRVHIQRIKEGGKRMFVRDLGGQPEVWVQRPLPTKLIEYAAVDVRYLIGIKELWSGASTGVVFNVTKDRLQDAVSARAPAKGDHMSKRDFSLGSNTQFLGHPAVEAPRCYNCNQQGHIARSCPHDCVDEHHSDHDNDYHPDDHKHYDYYDEDGNWTTHYY